MPEKDALDSSSANFFPDILARSPILTSYDAGWNSINLEFQDQPPGEAPEFCFDHDIVAINIGCHFRAKRILDGTASQTTQVSHGATVFCPKHYRYRFCWNRSIQALTLNLKSEMITSNAIELLETDCVEFIPQFGVQDALIHQLGLTLQAELQSQRSHGRLYAETMANALAVHLLRHYSTQKQQTIDYNSELPQQKLKLVIDYINDCLERELSLSELAAIAQLSQYHFCRIFKASIGLSPHQYLIQQRVERAKLLLQQGDMTVGTVAMACGFTHQSHLNRHFKRLTGITPDRGTLV